MDIKILDSHLREYLDSKITPKELARCVSLCGPTFERTNKVGSDYLYEIEVTTNRVDAASVYGIAREAAAILPQFGISAKLKKLPPEYSGKTPSDNLPLKLVSAPRLVNRLTGIVLDDIKSNKSPQWLIDRLEAADMRSINAVVDITNYVMLSLGHPCHAFDYDKIKGHTLRVRESVKGEKITTFDDKAYILHGGDIVFEDTRGQIIDLPGIVGTKNSVVNETTNRVLFFFDNFASAKIRKTSMELGIRTVAATLNEKSVDPEIIPQALAYGLELFHKICKARPASRVYDIYHRPYKPKTVIVEKSFIDGILGLSLEKTKITSILSNLGFSASWKGETAAVAVPSFRAHDIAIPEDIVEEIARIYGYHNLPSKLMAGNLPEPIFGMPFKFEAKLRQDLRALGANEVLTYSLVSKEMAGKKALRLSNPLGADTEYLRTSLKPSLTSALSINSGVENPYHLFEIANVYIPQKGKLPLEQMMLAGIFANTTYRHAKGVLEALFESVNINVQPKMEVLGKNSFYYEYKLEMLVDSQRHKTYTPLPKYPPQIEDITISIPEGKPVGNVIQSIKQADSLVHSVELVDVYERNFTFRIEYLHPDKTLSDKEVEKVRKKIESKVL